VAAREAAARVVGRVLRSGAYATQAVRAETTRLDPEAARHAQALAFAVLRRLRLLDHQIAGASRRRIDRIQPAVLDVLRVGAAELAGGKSPAIAVSAAVAAVRALGHPAAAGFVNAVLRRVAADPAPLPVGSEGRGMELGVPGWLLVRMEGAWGAEEAAAFFRASLGDAAVGVRLAAGAPPPPGVEPVAGIPGAGLIRGVPPPGITVQDPASVAVGLAVGAEPGMVVLDLAAAPGGKTAQLVEAVGPEGRVVALEAHPRRAADAARRVPQARWVLADGRRPPFAPRSFDRVLVDAPCSGLGTLRRRPEIRHRVTAEEVARLARLQRDLLEAAMRLVRPGGRVVYSVCTVLPEETAGVVAGLAARPPEGLPGRREGDGWLLAPHLGPTDGMFVALLEGPGRSR
jgi:16S rRNA (cytosine967-C5)-methyltransferase